MNAETIHLLNRLLAIHCRSFPQYLRYSEPYVRAGRAEVLETVTAIAQDQDVLADRISRMIVDADGLPRTGEFPMEFTDLHDLDLDFLMQLGVRYQEQDVAAIQAIVDRLQESPAARAIAEEALGMAKGHLDSLREAAAAPAGA
jgi:bacterioferritin (cytochrome b1)